MEKPFSKYVSSPLDEKYSVAPPAKEFIEEDALPPEEFEVRKNLAKYVLALIHRDSMNVVDRMLDYKEFRKWDKLVKDEKARMKDVFNKSPLHKAAMMRMVNNSPKDSDIRKLYDECLNEKGK